MTASCNDMESKNAMRYRSSGICYLLALPAILLIFIFKIIPLMGAIMLPFKDYTPIKGMVGSSWVGMGNFEQVFSSFAFPKVVGNTLVLKFEYILLCGLIALGLALALSLIRSRGLQKFFSTLFLLPYFIPTAVFGYIALQMMGQEGPGFLFLFHTDSLMHPHTFRTVYIALEIVKNVGIPVILAMGAIYARTGLSGEKGDCLHARLIPALKAIGLFALLQLSALLTTDFELLNSFANPLVYETADTLDTYTFKRGLVNGQYSVQAVIWLIQFMVQLVLSIPIYLLIKSFFTKGVLESDISTKKPLDGPGNLVGTSLGIIVGSAAALLLFLPLILSLIQIGGMSGEGIEGMGSLSIGRAFATYIPITLLGVLMNAVMTALLAYPLTVSNLPGRRVYKVFLIIILGLGSSGVHEYLFYKSLGMVNTYLPYLFTGLFTIVNVFVLKAIYNARYTQREQRTVYGREGDGASFFQKYLPGIYKPLLGLAGLQFMMMWNSYAPSQLWYISDMGRFSPIMMFRNMMMVPQGEAYRSLAPMIMKNALWVSLPSLIIGILLVVFVGHGIFASQIRKS